MSLNHIEARSGLCFSPVGSPPGPPSDPTLFTTRDIITQLHALGVENLDPSNIRLALTDCPETILNKLGQRSLPVIEVSASELATAVYEIREGTIYRGGNLLPVVDTRTNKACYSFYLDKQGNQLRFKDRNGEFHPWQRDNRHNTVAALVISKPARRYPNDIDSFDIYAATIPEHYNDMFYANGQLLASPGVVKAWIAQTEKRAK